MAKLGLASDRLTDGQVMLVARAWRVRRATRIVAMFGVPICVIILAVGTWAVWAWWPPGLLAEGPARIVFVSPEGEETHVLEPDEATMEVWWKVHFVAGLGLGGIGTVVLYLLVTVLLGLIAPPGLWLRKFLQASDLPKVGPPG